MRDGWGPDILGTGYEQRTLPLGTDDEGELVATLVRRRRDPLGMLTGPLHDVDVLYIHGWSDYFFQRDEADFWARLGARFHALDLRKYGRSLREGQTPGYVADLEVYDADIAAALEAMGRGPRTTRRLIVVAHSTGGLIATLWAARHPGVADALVLNAPWLELQTGSWGRQALAPLVTVRAKYDPLGTHPVVDLGFYTRAQREVGTLPDAPDGWRPERGFPTHPGWLNAVIEGHTAVARGVDVGCPALVLLSTRSTAPLRWLPSMLESDSVLVVDDIARAALRIGRVVTVARIEGALHDVFLSAPEPRATAFRMLRDWAVGLPRGQ
ncbi:alpha/beta hydrolase [Microbacterium sp. GXF7504]